MSSGSPYRGMKRCKFVMRVKTISSQNHYKVVSRTHWMLHITQLACQEDLSKDKAADMQACVLVIDDDSHARFILSKVIRRLGYKVVEAENGEEALDILSDASSPVVNMVLTDIWMPR